MDLVGICPIELLFFIKIIVLTRTQNLKYAPSEFVRSYTIRRKALTIDFLETECIEFSFSSIHRRKTSLNYTIPKLIPYEPGVVMDSAYA